MDLDLREITEKLITEMLTEAENLRQQAEGVRKLFIRIAQESEKLSGQQHPVTGTEATTEE